MKIPRFSFNAGEIAPVLWWRSDLAKYGSSCEKLENYMNLPQGGIRRRFGTQLLAKVAEPTDNARVIPWEVSRSTYFEMVFVGSSIKIFNNNGGQVEEITSIPWSDTELQELYFKQVFDVMYITHPNHPVQKISRTSSLVWELEEFEFSPPPIGDTNSDDTNEMTLTNTGGDSFDVTTTQDTFKASDVGRTLRVRSQQPLSDSGNYNSASQGTTSTPIFAKGEVTMRTEGGIWEGRLELQKLAPGKTEWVTVGSITSEDGNHNGEIKREINEVGTQARVFMAERSNATSDDGCKWTIEVSDVQYDYYRITQYVSATEVDADRYLGSDEDKTSNDFAFGVFGDDEGYPTCIEIHEERMMLAGVLSKPSTVFGSRTNVWTDFSGGTFATSSIQFSLSADVRNRTRWMVTEQALIMGTDYGEWSIGSRDGSSSLSGENVVAKRHTQHGTDPVQAITGSDMTLYIEAGGKRMRAMQYNFTERDGYVSVDLSILSPHLTQNSGLKRMAFSRSPDQIVWCVREDGELLAFSYEREQQVSAWSRHPFSDGGSVLDVNSILTDAGDVVTLLVKRNEGLYLEAITQDALCFDWQTFYTGVQTTDVITLLGNENFKIYDNNLEIDENFNVSKSESIFIKLINPPADLVIKYDGQTLDASDYVNMEYDFIWLPQSSDKGLVEILDFNTPITEGDDYVLYNKSECLVLNILNSAFTVSSLIIKDGVTPLVLGTDYLNMSSVNQALIFTGSSANNITAEFSSVPLNGEDYDVFTPKAQVNPPTIQDNNFYVAIQMDSEMRTTDIASSPGNGGGGNRSRANEVDLFLVESVGGEVSMNGLSFAPVKYPFKDVVAGQRLEDFTGKIEVRTPHGYQPDGLRFSFRNSTAYNQIIASIGVQAQGYST